MELRKEFVKLLTWHFKKHDLEDAERIAKKEVNEYLSQQESEQDKPVTIEDFNKLEGSEVEIIYRHLHGNNAKREGRLEIEHGWAYVYDKGKRGKNFNGAFDLNEELKEIISIQLISTTDK